MNINNTLRHSKEGSSDSVEGLLDSPKNPAESDELPSQVDLQNFLAAQERIRLSPLRHLFSLESAPTDKEPTNSSSAN
jgi:hypothetical protein